MNNHNETCSLTARWILPMAGPPLENGIVRIDGERIAGVESRGWGRADVDLGDVAVLPGFVNCHTHLDLSGLQGKCPLSADFTAWLRSVIAHRRGQTEEQIQTDIRKGLEMSIRHGTTLLGDISASGKSWDVLAAAPIRSVVFHELIGLTEERAEQAWQQAQDWLAAHQPTENCRPGLSPHAPYSVRKSLFKNVASLPAEIPVAIHIAETKEELQLLENRQGPFVKFLKELGAWDTKGLVSSIRALLKMYAKRPLLVVHGNYLDRDTLYWHNNHLVYCPRTHAAFGHRHHPWRHFWKLGVNVALGTDSLASNPGVDMLGEIRFLHRNFSALPPEFLLDCITTHGAQALGWSTDTGSLTPGKSADLVVVPLQAREHSDPFRLIIESNYDVQKVMCRGKWIGQFDSARSVT